MLEPGRWIVGIDFDNTLVSYDSLLFAIAEEQGLINLSVNPGKKAIRDRIRLLPDGENRWQELQAVVYGPRIGGAALIEGAWEFITRCRVEGRQVYIVSHKTEYANLGNPRANLREAALQWMEQNRFFDADGLGLSASQVFFGATRQEKITHIRRLGCTHFIDDLEEVFLERDFPASTEKILYAPQSEPIPSAGLPDLKTFPTWRHITDYLFTAG